MDTPSFTSDYLPGDFVPFHLIPYIVVISFFVSLVGTITTVELLHRRSSGRGWRTWLHLASCSVSMGLVAIWCMHFVGNRAIILGNGEHQLQLYYSSAYTAVSVFLPIVFLFVGFAVAEKNHRNRKNLFTYVVVSGVVAGLSIAGMHYIGNLGVVNYRLVFGAPYIAGAIIIAIVACVVALTLFFMQRELWINSWWRRLICAVVMAGAVSGMHWVASMGTRYQLKHARETGAGASRNVNVIVAIIMCLLACICCLGIAFATKRRRRQLADRAQQVILATAVFDAEGRLLVTQEGLLPCQKITKQYNQRSFDDEFNISHPVFRWIYRVTHYWLGVEELIPSMRAHLRGLNTVKDPSKPGSPDSLSLWEGTEGDEDYSVIFRESFCVAAHDLAESLQQPVQSLGVLYDGIMMTGTLATDLKIRSRHANNEDVELGKVAIPRMFGKGQLLFLVRQADKADVSRLTSAGYRFASMSQVGDILARSMQVPLSDIVAYVERLRAYCEPDQSPPAGSTSLACFVLRPNVKASGKGWEVLVKENGRGDLPQVALTSEPLQPWQNRMLSRLDGLSVSGCMSLLNNKTNFTTRSEESFAELLISRISVLAEQVKEPFFRQAIFSSKMIKVHKQAATDTSTYHVGMMAFCIIPDVHSASLRSTAGLAYTPFTFFKCRQQVYNGAPDHAALARQIHQEFSPIVAQKDLILPANDVRKGSLSGQLSPRGRFSKWPFGRQGSPRTSMSVHPDSSSERGLVGVSSRIVEPSSTHVFGGIMVSSDIRVDSNSKEDSTVELRHLGTQAEASVAVLEQPNYADELFGITVSRWQYKS